MPLGKGDKLISEGDVRNALLRSFGNTLEGTNLGNLEVERMERVMEEDPFVANADTSVDQNNILHVRIKQREPLIRVLNNNGGNYYLDKKGVKCRLPKTSPPAYWWPRAICRPTRQILWRKNATP